MTVAALTKEGVNPKVTKAEYAVRGKLYTAAVERSKEGKKVIYTNLGNPHGLGQKPITFSRQVLALVNYPELIEDTVACSRFPRDAIQRAKTYLEHMPGGPGAYQDSRGNEYIRSEVAQFLDERDGFLADPKDIYLTDGASGGVSRCLQLLIGNSKDAILTPTPQYPLYSATIDLCGGTNVGYFLDEESGWGLSVEELDRATAQARESGCNVRALVVINPGNPTGQCLSYENMVEITRWCAREKVVLFADEVYQTNVYVSGKNFTSFRKVIHTDSESANVECFSFHTISKGVVGECGHRGGYMHCLNIGADVQSEIYKLSSINLCSNTDGQIMVGIMSNPPKPGDESYELYEKETHGLYDSLKRRAEFLAPSLNKLDGITCNPVEGALYAFPQIHLPERAKQKATEQGLAPDVFYCLALLDETGLCTIPGSGFGQKDGSLHFRTTILPPEKDFEHIVSEFERFHNAFMAEYA